MASKYAFKSNQCPNCGRPLSNDKVPVDYYLTWLDGRGKCPGCGSCLQLKAPPNIDMKPETVKSKTKPEP